MAVIIPDFYFFWTVDDYNSAKEVMNKAWRDVIPNMEQDWGSKFSKTLDGWDDFFLKAIDNLSYDPETSVEGLVYAEMWISYLQPGTWDQYTNTFKLATKIAKKQNFNYPFGRFSNDIGMNGPAFISVFLGKNPPDLYAQLFKDWEILGEEVQEMINDLSSTTRKFEKIPFWSLKELSYSPE